MALAPAYQVLRSKGNNHWLRCICATGPGHVLAHTAHTLWGEWGRGCWSHAVNSYTDLICVCIMQQAGRETERESSKTWVTENDELDWSVPALSPTVCCSRCVCVLGVTEPVCQWVSMMSVCRVSESCVVGVCVCVCQSVCVFCVSPAAVSGVACVSVCLVWVCVRVCVLCECVSCAVCAHSHVCVRSDTCQTDVTTRTHAATLTHTHRGTYTHFFSRYTLGLTMGRLHSHWVCTWMIGVNTQAYRDQFTARSFWLVRIFRAKVRWTQRLTRSVSSVWWSVTAVNSVFPAQDLSDDTPTQRSLGGFFPELGLFHVRLRYAARVQCPVSIVALPEMWACRPCRQPGEKREDWPGARKEQREQLQSHSHGQWRLLPQKILALLTSGSWSPLHRPGTARILLQLVLCR